MEVASLKETIAKKDEEIEHLQLLKDLRTQLPNGNGLRHSSSSPGFSSPDGMAQRGQRLLGGRATTPMEKVPSDTENGSEFSDKHSDAGSLQSVDADSEERLSDASDGGHSVGAEADSSERAEFTLLPENGRTSDAIREKMPKAPSRVPKPLPQRTVLSMSARPKLRDPMKSTVPRKSTTSQTTASSVKPLRR